MTADRKQQWIMAIATQMIGSLVIGAMTSFVTLQVLKVEIAHIQREHERFVGALSDLERRIGNNEKGDQAVVSERSVRRHEIDRRLDALERRLGLTK